MNKVKIGDQRFKKKSYIAHLVAAMSGVFVLLGVFIVLSSISRVYHPVILQPTAAYVPTAEYLWQHPTSKPSYLVFTPNEQAIPAGSKICFKLQRGGDGLIQPAAVRSLLQFDGTSLPYFDMAWNENYCFQPEFKKGYHFVEFSVASGTQWESLAQWGILVE